VTRLARDCSELEGRDALCPICTTPMVYLNGRLECLHHPVDRVRDCEVCGVETIHTDRCADHRDESGPFTTRALLKTLQHEGATL